MTIKELKKILAKAPDDKREVYIPHMIITEKSGSLRQETSTSIGHNFDDNCDLELYIIGKE